MTMHHIKAAIFKPDGKQRSGRGFSRDEIDKAGLTPTQAAGLDIPVDYKRKTAHDENVKAIEECAAKQKVIAKPKPKPEPKVASKKKSKSQKSP